MKAKRLSSGYYKYRGYIIERQPCGRWVLGETAAAITLNWDDSETTLRECKARIDGYHRVTTKDNHNE